MNNRIRILACLTLIFGVAAALTILSSPRAALASGERPDDAKTLIKLDEEWSRAAGKKDVELVSSFYAENALVYPPNEPTVTGKAAAKAVWASLAAMPDFSLSWKATHAEVSGDLGFTAGPYVGVFNGPDGKPINDKGKYLCVWKKQADGSWKAIHDMWNSDFK